MGTLSSGLGWMTLREVQKLCILITSSLKCFGGDIWLPTTETRGEEYLAKSV